MLENLNYLFQYLEREQINIDKNEFQFQIQSHPDYPSLLSIIDTLSFFNIDNGVLNVELSELELLPDCFVSLLETQNSQPKLHLVEKKGDTYFCTKDKNKIVISKQELELRWKNTVLLVEKSTIDSIVPSNKNKWFWVFPFLCIGLFFLMLMQFQITIATKLFFVFPVLGVLFSIAALKDLFGTKSELLNSFCTITSSSSCTSVVGSSKWKIFEIINFSDLSIVFFSFQFLGLLVSLFMTDVNAYFSTQKMLLLFSVPVLITSIYYQKFIEKKWCPICLVIISIILLELGSILFLYKTSFDLQMYPLIAFGFIFATVALGWFALKNLLIHQKELKEFQIKGNQFMRNYEIFKNNLLASQSIENSPLQSGETILLGNPEAPVKIIIVTSPFCGFCAEAHSKIEKIITQYSKKVCCDIHFNFNEVNDDQKSKKIHHQLGSIYFNQGQEAFMKALHDWFKNKDENKLKNFDNSVISESKLNPILEKQFNWNKLNSINYTPAIIINGYFLPKQYAKIDLVHFINELSEDNDF